MHMIRSWAPAHWTQNTETGWKTLLPDGSTSGLILDIVIKLLLDVLVAHELLVALDFKWHWVLVFDAYLKQWMIYWLLFLLCNNDNVVALHCIAWSLHAVKAATLHSKYCIQTEYNNMRNMTLLLRGGDSVELYSATGTHQAKNSFAAHFFQFKLEHNFTELWANEKYTTF